MTSTLQKAAQINSQFENGQSEAIGNAKSYAYRIALRDFLGKPLESDARDLLEIIEISDWTLEDYREIIESVIPTFVRGEATRRRNEVQAEIERAIGFLVRDCEKFILLINDRLRTVQNQYSTRHDPHRDLAMQKLRDRHPELLRQDEPLVEILAEAIGEEIDKDNESSIRNRSEKESEARRKFESLHKRRFEEGEVGADWDYATDASPILQIVDSLGGMMQKRHQSLVNRILKLEGKPAKFKGEKSPNVVQKIAAKVASSVTK